MSDLLGEVGARAGMDAALDSSVIWAKWREAVGGSIADHAEPTSLKSGVLRVRADSSGWATEISYLRDEIKAKLNDIVGRSVIEEVRIWTGPGSDKPRRAEQVRHAPGVPPRPAQVPPPDPAAALDRARNAWSKRRRKGR